MKSLSLVILRLCIGFQFHMNPGTSKRVCGGWVECEFSVLLWSKTFSFRLKLWAWTKPNNILTFTNVKLLNTMIVRTGVSRSLFYFGDRPLLLEIII